MVVKWVIFKVSKMKKLAVLDLEVYPNYTLFAFKCLETNKVATYEIKGEQNTLTNEQRDKIIGILKNRTTFGYNSRNYDMPIIIYALMRTTAYEIYQLSNNIIINNQQGWQTYNIIGKQKPNAYEHFDVQEPAPGVGVSLKLYGGRMHSKHLQDLPIEPGSILTPDDMVNMRDYCINDLDTTIELYENIKGRISLRGDMTKKYGQDLMSKSDSQIAEAVIKSELKRLNPHKTLKAPTVPKSATYRYTPPKYLSFIDDKINDVFNFITSHAFKLDGRGSIKLPDYLKESKINIGASTYQVGIGGLHSCEKNQTVISNDDEILVDRDVTSYYPMIILNLGLYPKHLGASFLSVYQKIVLDRLKAKKAGNKIVADSLKIVINGSFGKFGSHHSALYSPDLLMAVTLTGQLSLLMLIEQLEQAGIQVVSANTDGFVSKMKKSQYDKYDEICAKWQAKTSFNLEETRYKALYSRDVNNYMAITDTGEVKGKGIFGASGLAKNPQAPICVTAVSELLSKGIPIRDTIMQCNDIRHFIHVRTVKGGAVYKGEYLGRVVRWYYSKNGDIIAYKNNGNKVAKTDGSRPVMTIADLPKDIDYKRYINEAIDILADLRII